MTASDFEAILPQVDAALARRDPASAFRLLAPYKSELGMNRELAGVWMTLLRAQPAYEAAVEDIQGILAAYPNDRVLQLAGCDALIRVAELRGADLPGAAEGAAELAARVAAENLAGLSSSEVADAKLGGYWHMAHANALRLAHRYAEAEPAYAAALALDSGNGEWWFNASLLQKAQGDFGRGLEATQRAHALLGDRRGVLWNLALCATALGRGELAVSAMRKLGFDARALPSGMPHVDGLPPVQVRVATLGSGHGFGGASLDRGVAFELVWVSPASPCHGVVQTPTFRDASVDYGDVVLWDGTPIGVTEHDGKPVPRFPLLCRLRPGDERRFRFVALEQRDGDVSALAADLPEPSQLFVHRAKVELLCARCASGEHMHKHQHEPAEPHRLVYGKLVVEAGVALPEFRSALDTCLSRHPGVQLVVPSLLEALGDTHAAGKAHQIWRGLERSAVKMGSATARSDA